MIIDNWDPTIVYPNNKVIKFMGKLYICKRAVKGVIPIPLINKTNALGSYNNTSSLEAVKALQVELFKDKGVTANDLTFNTDGTWILSH